MSLFYNTLKIFSLWIFIISILLFVNFTRLPLLAEGFSIVSTSLYVRFVNAEGDLSSSNFIEIDAENNLSLGGDSGRLVVLNHTSNDMWNVNIGFPYGFVDGLGVDPVSNFMLSSPFPCENIEFSNGSEEVFLQGVTSNITLISSSGNSLDFCHWYLDGIEIKNVLKNDRRGFSMILSIL